MQVDNLSQQLQEKLEHCEAEKTVLLGKSADCDVLQIRHNGLVEALESDP